MSIGLNAKTYRNTGTFGTPTWTLMTNITDMTLDDSMDEADTSTRGGGGFSASEPTLRNLELTFGMINKPGTNAEFEAVLDAYTGRTSLDLAVMDGVITTIGQRGVRARWKVHQFPRAQELRGAQTIEVVMKPCIDDTNGPPVDMEISP